MSHQLSTFVYELLCPAAEVALGLQRIAAAAEVQGWGAIVVTSRTDQGVVFHAAAPNRVDAERVYGAASGREVRWRPG